MNFLGLVAATYLNGSFCMMVIFVLQIEAIVTKDEVEHLAFLCKSEVESMGRIAAGVLRLLKLEKTIGQSAIDQLGNLGMVDLITFLSILFWASIASFFNLFD